MVVKSEAPSAAGRAVKTISPALTSMSDQLPLHAAATYCEEGCIASAATAPRDNNNNSG